MKKLLLTIFLFSFSFFGFLVFLHLNDSVPKARAVEITMDPTDPDENNPFVTITISGLTPDTSGFGICLRSECLNNSSSLGSAVNFKADSNEEGKITLEKVCSAGGDRLKDGKDGCDSGDYFAADKTYRLAIYDPDSDQVPLAIHAFNVGHAYPKPPPPFFSTLTPTPSDNLTITVCGNRHPFGLGKRNQIDFDFNGPGNPDDPGDITLPEGECKTATLGNLNTGDYTFTLRWQAEDFALYSFGIHVTTDGSEGITGGENVSSPGGSTEAIETTFTPSCDEEGNCPDEFKTPIGTISTDPAGFATDILSLGIGIAGGIAFILMIFGAYRLMFAGGNPDAMQQGREIITAAVAGLIVVVFAIFILRLIGFTILGLGSF